MWSIAIWHFILGAMRWCRFESFRHSLVNQQINTLIHANTKNPTIHCEFDAAFSCKGVISDGDLHVVYSLIRQFKVMEQKCAILKHQDSVSVLRPQVTDDLCADGLNHSDRLVSLQLPFDDWWVQTGAEVSNREQCFSAHCASDQSPKSGDVHPFNGPCAKDVDNFTLFGSLLEYCAFWT